MSNLTTIKFGKGFECVQTRTQDIQSYYESIRQFPVLTPDEEVELAILIRKGNEQAKEKMIQCNLRAVVSIVKKQYAQCANQSVTLMDMVSAGNIGLMKAVDKFDPTRGFKFLSFAINDIRAAILNEINNVARIVSDRHGVTPIAHTSLDVMVGDNEDTPMSDVICTSTDPESFKNESLAADLIRVMNNILNQKEAYLICNLYGIGRVQKRRWEMGEELGMTSERVRQIEFYALNKLRNNPKAISLLGKYLS